MAPPKVEALKSLHGSTVIVAVLLDAVQTTKKLPEMLMAPPKVEALESLHGSTETVADMLDAVQTTKVTTGDSDGTAESRSTGIPAWFNCDSCRYVGCCTNYQSDYWGY